MSDMEDRIDRMEEALHRIASWAQAYPLEAFPEPSRVDWARARMVLEDSGLSLDRISASNMRHVITQVGKIADEGRAPLPPPPGEAKP
jgi:hypothetical protein